MNQRTCPCGGHFNYIDNEFVHAAGCMLGQAPAAKIEPSNVASFALARADKGSKPREHRPADALDLARDWIASCGPNDEPQHIIVFLGRTNSDNSSGTKYFQTGSLSAHAQVGLVIEGLDLLRGTGK